MIGLSDATIWRLEKKGKFPRRISLGGNSVGWFDTEINGWLAKKASDRTESQAQAIDSARAER